MKCEICGKENLYKVAVIYKKDGTKECRHDSECERGREIQESGHKYKNK